MSLGTPLAVLLAILFLVPGLLWKMAADVSSPYAKRKRTHLLECLLLSCVNYLLAILPLYILVQYWPETLDLQSPQSIPKHTGYLVWWILLVFLLPVIGGFVTGKLLTRPRMVKILHEFGIGVVHPAPSGWDYAFARNERYWTRIELTDGGFVEGIFDSNSLASSEYDDRDIFIESVFEFNEETEEYEQLEQNAGVLVRADVIKSITFFKQPDSESEEPDAKNEPPQEQTSPQVQETLAKSPKTS